MDDVARCEDGSAGGGEGVSIVHGHGQYTGMYIMHVPGHLDHPPPCPPPPLSPGGHILQGRRTTWWSDYMFTPHSFQPSGILTLRLRLLFILSGKYNIGGN